jgi:hypothetical protein
MYTEKERKEGKKNALTSRLGARKLDDTGHDTSEDFRADLLKKASELLKLSQKPCADCGGKGKINNKIKCQTCKGSGTMAKAAIAELESLSDATRAMLFTTNTDLRQFAEEYYFISDYDPTAGTTQAVLEARRALEALGEDSFADHVDKYAYKQKKLVLADAGLKAAYNRSVEKRTKEASRSEEERDREAIERQKAMRAKAQPQLDALKRRMAGTPTVKAEAVSKEVDRAVKLLELSTVKTDDLYRTVVIQKQIKDLPDTVKAAAESILGSKT